MTGLIGGSGWVKMYAFFDAGLVYTVLEFIACFFSSNPDSSCPINRPHCKRAKKRPADDIPQRDRNARRPDEFAHAESRPVEHADRDQKIVGDAVLVAHRRKGADNDPDAVDLGRVVASLGGEEECKADEPVAHYSSRHVVAPVDVDASFGLRDGVGCLRVCVQSVGPPEENARVEETAGDVKDVANDPVACQVVDGCPPHERGVCHNEHVARAQLHVGGHDDDEAGREGESADECSERGIAGSQTRGSSGEDQVKAGAERDEDSRQEGFGHEIYPGEVSFRNASLLGEM
jgi:hypothetical protein